MDTVRNGALMSIVKSYTCIVTLNVRKLEFSGRVALIVLNHKNMAFPTSHGSRIVSVPFEINISAIFNTQQKLCGV